MQQSIEIWRHYYDTSNGFCALKSLPCLCSRTCPWSSFLFTNPTSTTCSSLWSCSVTTSRLRTSQLETISASRSSGKTSPKPRSRSPGAWLGSLRVKSNSGGSLYYKGIKSDLKTQAKELKSSIKLKTDIFWLVALFDLIFIFYFFYSTLNPHTK